VTRDTRFTGKKGVSFGKWKEKLITEGGESTPTLLSDKPTAVQSWREKGIAERKGGNRGKRETQKGREKGGRVTKSGIETKNQPTRKKKK